MKYTITLDKLATFFNSNLAEHDQIGYKLNGDYDDNCYFVQSLDVQNIHFEAIPTEIKKLLSTDGMDSSNCYIYDGYLEFDDVIKLPYFNRVTPNQEYAATFRITIKDENGEKLDTKRLHTVFDMLNKE